jgi:hypothetical protein
MKTASFFTYQGPGRVSIARWAPPGHPSGYRVYRPLNPRREHMKLPPAAFDPLYREQLAGLDPRQVWEELHRLAGDAEPVLLCWEKPPFVRGEHWCHRRHVAEWLGEELGIEVAEMDGSPHNSRQQP